MNASVLDSGSAALRSVEVGAVIRFEDDRLRQELIGQLAPYEKRWPKRQIDLFGGEAGDRELSLWHLLLTMVEPNAEGVEGVQFQLERTEYHLARRLHAARVKRLRKEFDALDSALAIVYGLRARTHLHCTTLWSFEVDEVETVVPLPFLKLDLGNGAFEQVSGVRFSSSSQENHNSFILDLDEESTKLYATGSFAFTDVVAPGLLQAVVDRAEKLLLHLLTRRDLGAQHGAD